MDKNILVCFALLIIMVGTAFGQKKDTPSITAQASAIQKQLNADPKMAVEEQTLPVANWGIKPAKIIETPDDKMTDIPPGEPAPWKVEVLADQKETMQKTGTTMSEMVPAAQEEASGQPVPEKSVEVMDYRKLKGPNTQPEPQEKGQRIKYRELKGPNTQPAGEGEPE